MLVLLLEPAGDESLGWAGAEGFLVF